MYFVPTTEPRTYMPGAGKPPVVPVEPSLPWPVMFWQPSDQFVDSKAQGYNPPGAVHRGGQKGEVQKTEGRNEAQKLPVQEQSLLKKGVAIPEGQKPGLIKQPSKPEKGKADERQSSFKVEQTEKPAKSTDKPDKQADKNKKGSQKAEPSRTSNLVGAFKITNALIAAGVINAFLFGTPLWVAGGLSVAFAVSQLMLARKFEKEDTAATRWLMNLIRKMTGKETDKTAASKERAMAFVMGGISAALALLESGLNDLYDRYNGKPKETVKQILERLTKGRNQSSAWLKPLYSAQIYGVGLRKQLESALPKGASQQRVLISKLWQLANKYMKGNKLFAYSCSAVTSFAGGYIQSHMAAQLQDGIDKHNGKFK